MTLAEFLEWEEGQPLRYEFDGVGPVAMVRGSVRHAQIQRNLAFALTARLRGKPSQFLGSDLKIQTEEDHARYPDGIVICSPLTGSETKHDTHRPVREGSRVSGHVLRAAPEIEVKLALAELYEGIVFEAQDQSDQPPKSEPT